MSFIILTTATCSTRFSHQCINPNFRSMYYHVAIIVSEHTNKSFPDFSNFLSFYGHQVMTASLALFKGTKSR